MLSSMSDIAIRAENIGKRYRIGWKKTAYTYRTFREAILDSLAAPIRWIKSERKSSESFWALDDVSFTVNHGEAVGIIGRNGAGKSTLLKVLSRITKPTKGRIELYGRVASLLEVGTGFHPELSGRDNIYLNGAILGMSRGEMNRKFDEIVDFSGVEKFLDTPVKHYSSGMYVRLAFAVAAHLEPEILVVDEVLAVGDMAFQKKCLGKMSDVAKSGRTILFVSHNMSAIKQLCPTSILLETGKVIKQGPSPDVVNFYLSNLVSDQISSQQEYPPDKDKPVQIRKIVIQDQRENPVDFVDLNEQFIIKVDYEFRENLDNISIGCQIIADENNQCLISLSDPELDITRLDKREIGYYQSTIVIPAKILNTGSYTIRLGASNRFQIFDVVENIAFSVVDNQGIVQSLGYERKNALLSLQLPWQAIRLDGNSESLPK